jgi:hypothetical protein
LFSTREKPETAIFYQEIFMFLQKLPALLLVVGLAFQMIAVAAPTPTPNIKNGELSPELKQNVLKLLTELAGETAQFALPENRVGTQTIIAGLMWEHDHTAGAPVNSLITDMKPIGRSQLKDSPHFVNSESFAGEFIKIDPKFTALVLFDHVTNDWRDVVSKKINVSTAIFSGEESNNLPSQRWAASVIPNATLYAYTKKEQGDHFLMFKNPFKFTGDLQSFLEK